jgi:PPP family 3-phenylpropionic acid transporter
MFPIVDGAAMQAASVHGFAYGRLRLCGSVSYLVMVLVLGQCLDWFGNDVVFPVLLSAMVAMAASSLALPRTPVRPAAEREPSPWWQPLRSWPFVLLLVATAAIQGSHATFYNLSTIHWLDHGISKTWASVLWAEGVLAEIVLFAVARETVDRLRPTTLLLVGGGAAVLRWCVVGATTSLPLLLATNWLHALSFGCTYLGSLRAIERRVPEQQRATAQGLLGAANSGVGMVVCGVLGGVLYERWEGFAFFTMAAFAAFGAGVAFLLRRMADQPSHTTSKAAAAKPE